MKFHWLAFQQTKGLNVLIDFFSRPVFLTHHHKTNFKHTFAVRVESGAESACRDSHKAYEKNMWRHPGGHRNSVDNSHHPRNPWLRSAPLQPLSRLLPEASFPPWTSVAWDATGQNSQQCYLSKHRKNMPGCIMHRYVSSTPVGGKSDALTTPFTKHPTDFATSERWQIMPRDTLAKPSLEAKQNHWFPHSFDWKVSALFFAGLDWFEAEEWLNPIKLESRLLMYTSRHARI